MSGKQRRNLVRILVASAMMVALHFAPARGLLRFVLYLVPLLSRHCPVRWARKKSDPSGGASVFSSVFSAH